MERTLNPTKVWNKGFILIFIANVFMHMGQQTITTLVPKYAYSLGATSTIVGIVSGAFAMSALLSKPFTSPLFLCVKKKHLYLISCVLLMSAYVIYYVAPNVNWIIGGRFFHGIGIGMAAPLSLNMACDNLPEDKFAKGVGLFSLGQAFGQALGPSIGLSLSKSIGYKNTFAICFVSLLICLVIAFFVDSNPRTSDRYQIRLDTILEKRAIPIAITMLFIVMAYSCIPSFLAIYGELLSIDNIGLYFTVYAIGLLVLRPLVSGLADKHGYVKVIVPSLVLFSCTFLLFSLSKSIVLIIAAAVVGALSYGMAQPSIQALCMKMIPREKSGIGANTMFFMQDIGQFLGPTIAGAVVDMFLRSGTTDVQAYANTYRCMMIPLLAAAVIAFLLRNVYRKNMK